MSICKSALVACVGFLATAQAQVSVRDYLPAACHIRLCSWASPTYP